MDHIYNNWSEKEVLDFEHKVEEVLQVLKFYPRGFELSVKQKNTRKAIITKHTSIIYRIKGKTIDLLAFQDNRRNPSTQKY